jgi:hypothetical protein
MLETGNDSWSLAPVIPAGHPCVVATNVYGICVIIEPCFSSVVRWEQYDLP